MRQSINPCNCLLSAHHCWIKELDKGTGNSPTVLRLSVEQDLGFLDAVFGNGDDVTISAALAPAPQWP